MYKKSNKKKTLEVVVRKRSVLLQRNPFREEGKIVSLTIYDHELTMWKGFYEREKDLHIKM